MRAIGIEPEATTQYSSLMVPNRIACLLPLSFILWGCPSLSEPRPDKQQAQEASAAPSPGSAQAPVEISHILVAYKGARRAAPTVTRSKAEAKKEAQRLAQLAQGSSDFKALASEHSDGPTATRGGSLGQVRRGTMAGPFESAAFQLKPGEVSGVVETDFGFHVLKRDK